MPSSNFLVWVLHTGVSSDGTTLNSRAFGGVSASVTAARPPSRHLNPGAFAPTFTSGPIRSLGVPLNVTAFSRLVIVAPRWRSRAAAEGGPNWFVGAALRGGPLLI